MSASLAVTALGIEFQNPILLAAGTAAYGRELADVMPLESLGGFVTKAVSLEKRSGAPAPRVADFPGGMINAVGLANPGVDGVLAEDLPWIATHVRRPRVLVNVVGREAADFGAVVRVDRLVTQLDQCGAKPAAVLGEDGDAGAGVG